MSTTPKVAGKLFDAHLLRKLLRFVRPHWKLLLVAVALIPLASVIELSLPYLLKNAVDAHIAVNDVPGLGLIALLYGAGTIGRSLISTAINYVLAALGEHTMHDLRCAVHRHVLTRSASFFDRTPVGRVLTGMTNDVANVALMFSSGMVTLIADFVVLFAILGMMLYLSLHLTLIVLALSPILIPLFAWSRNVMRRAFRELRVKTTEMNTYFVERVSALPVVQTFCRETRTIDEYATISKEFREASLASQSAMFVTLPVVEGLAVIAGASVIAYAGATHAAVTAGLVVAFVDYSARFFAPVTQLATKYVAMQQAMAAAERVFELLDTQEPDGVVAASVAPEAPEPVADAAIEFREVQFAYRPTEPVLQGVDLTVPKGKTIAVVGATGSGKSTLVRLLSRNYDVNGGSVRLFGRDVRDWTLDDLRRRLTVVSQDVFLFSGTLADNVRLGRPDADLGQVEAALRQVGAERLLERGGTSLEIRERGSNLSTGERQLVSFARALIRDPEVLILDEATANVDPQTEEVIERALVSLFTGRTSLIIAHRLSTIRRADHIVVMSKGRVAEQGTRDELLAANGLYARYEAKRRAGDSA